MSSVKGSQAVQRKLRQLAVKAAKIKATTVVVGYKGVDYAIYVHENLEASHSPGQQAKFLEQPARELADSGELGRIIEVAIKSGAGAIMGMIIAGQRLQTESQAIVPVDLGNLKGSAFTDVE